MKRTLDRALAEIQGSIRGLHAVVLSVAPDGLIAWCWSVDDKPEIALGFAALDRAATICLEGLGASQSSRNLLLTAADAWVAAWPLYDDGVGEGGRERLVITTVFRGGLQSGMVMVYGSRIRMHVRAALDEARAPRLQGLRARIAERLATTTRAGATLQSIADTAHLELRRLERLEDLSTDELRRLAAATLSQGRLSANQLQ